MSKRDDIGASDFKNFHLGDIQSILDENYVSNKVLPEQESRRRLLKHARLVGCEREMLLIFAKADKMMHACANEAERKDMGKLFSTEIYRLLGGGGQLVIDGQLVCDDRPSQEKNANNLYLPKSDK
jgi:hypothetical protein